jgi:hypothetical protein
MPTTTLSQPTLPSLLNPEWNPFQRGRKAKELGKEASLTESAGRFITPLETYALSLEVNLDRAYREIQAYREAMKKLTRKMKRRCHQSH